MAGEKLHIGYVLEYSCRPSLGGKYYKIKNR